jgi:hypothetical protein
VRSPAVRWELHPEAVLTAAEVAAWLRVHPKTVRQLPIPYLPIGKRARRYEARDVLAFIAEHKRGAAA